MIPHLDLLLLALLHGSIIGCIVILGAILLNIFVLLVACCLLLMFVIFDTLQVFGSVSRLFRALMMDIKLGAVILLCMLINRVIDGSLKFKQTNVTVMQESMDLGAKHN
jgi:hypothetical protein